MIEMRELSGGTDRAKENHIDFLKVCRTCLRTISASQCLIDESIYEMIQSLTGVMMKKEDELPQQICTVCCRAIQFAYAFRQECQQVDTTLKTYIVEQKVFSKEESIDKGGEVVSSDEEKEEHRCPICRRLFQKFTEVERHIKVNHSVTNTNNYIKMHTCSVRLVRLKNVLSKGGPENIPKRANTPSTNVELVRGIVKEPVDFDKEAPDSPPDNHESLVESEPLTLQLSGEQSVNHTEIYFFSCTLCDWKCELYRDIIDHYVLNHVRGLPPFKCPLCDDVLKHRPSLRCHLKTHIGRAYKCQYCGMEYKVALMLKRHLFRHTGEKILCFLCKKSFKHIGALKAHFRWKIRENDLKHRNHFKGFSDLKIRRGKTALLDRPLLVTNEPLTNENFVEEVDTFPPTDQAKPYEPPQHDEHITNELRNEHSSIPIEQEVPQALTTKHEFVEESYEVNEQCSLPAKRELLELVDGSQKDEYIPKPLNDKSFAEGVQEVSPSPPTQELSQVPPTKREFVEDEVANEEECALLEVVDDKRVSEESPSSSPHVAMRAVKGTPELSRSPKEALNMTPKLQVSEKEIGHFFTCVLCNLKFEIYRDIIDHYVGEHTWGTSPFHCPLCSIKFMRNNALRKHLRSHVPQVYNCQYCCTAYKAAFMLKRHLLYHTGERPYACTYCNKRFKQKHGLSAHEETHAKNRDYKCEECHKGFCTLRRLRQHLERHKDASLRCSRCNKRFMTKFNLRRHKADWCKGE